MFFLFPTLTTFLKIDEFDLILEATAIVDGQLPKSVSLVAKSSTPIACLGTNKDIGIIKG